MSAQPHPVEMIMARGFVANLTTPAFLVDRDGVLVFYNEAAGQILGLTFEEAGPMPSEEWGSRFAPTRPDGQPLDAAELPLSIALSDGRAAHAAMRITSASGRDEGIEVTAFPVIGQDGQSGALAIFWSRGP
jgi:PAS domain-containing protein